jgi:hypothetical protein
LGCSRFGLAKSSAICAQASIRHKVFLSRLADQGSEIRGWALHFTLTERRLELIYDELSGTLIE